MNVQSNPIRVFTLVAGAVTALVAGLASPSQAVADNCPYEGDYIACLQAGETVDWCKQHVLNCDPTPPNGDEECEALLDESWEACEETNFFRIGLPYDLYVSDPGTCPYDSYWECLIDRQDVEWCKQHMLGCQEHEPVSTTVIPFSFSACVEEFGCLCFDGDGTIEFSGEVFYTDDEVCMQVTGYTYSGPFDGRAEDAIDQYLADNGGLICAPLECVGDE